MESDSNSLDSGTVAVENTTLLSLQNDENDESISSMMYDLLASFYSLFSESSPDDLIDSESGKNKEQDHHLLFKFIDDISPQFPNFVLTSALLNDDPLSIPEISHPVTISEKTIPIVEPSPPSRPMRDKLCPGGSTVLDGSPSCGNNCYSVCNHERFKLRIGPDYYRNHKKDTSPPALSTLLGVDCFEFRSKMLDMGSKLDFSDWLKDTNKEDYLIGPNKYLPRVFIVNCMMPKDCSTMSSFSSMFSDDKEKDGAGYSVVLYFLLSPDVAKAIRNPSSVDQQTNGNACKLLGKFLTEEIDYLRSLPKDHLPTPGSGRWKGRFKVIVDCENMDEMGLPYFITSYNAKPVLIRGFETISCGEDYFELDADNFRSGVIVRQGLIYLYEMFDKMEIHVGCCIESRNDAEMPESIMGSVTMHKPNINFAYDWEESVKHKELVRESL